MPANGLIYAPPNACACFGKVKTPGFFAAAPQRGKDGHMPFAKEPALQKGPAGDDAAKTQNAPGDWPMYRHDAARSGTVTTAVPSELKRRWSAPVGGRLTQPVIAGGTVFVAATDAHTVFALDAADGKPRWQFTAGGRVDSAPTLHDGRVCFGSADGYVYCLRASDGALAWRFRAAPQERLVSAYGQLESVWPCHGAVLVQNGMLYATAGRSTYLDGGIVLYALDPATGKELARHVVTYLDPDTGKQTGKEGRAVGAFDMEGTTSDVLSGDGESVFLKHLRFDKNCQPVAERKPHLFAVTGFLGEEWFVRSFWTIAEITGAGWGNWTTPTNSAPFGRILCVTDGYVYGYGRVKIASGATGHKADAYHLFGRSRTAAAPPPVEPPKAARKGAGKKAENAPGLPPPVWSDTQSLIVRAMVLAGDNLVVAGPPDVGQKDEKVLAFSNEKDALAGFEGRKGVVLRIVSAKDGAKRFETPLTAMPVFDGMAAANGAVFIALQDGAVECWAGR
jgi:hypothetical protein